MTLDVSLSDLRDVDEYPYPAAISAGNGTLGQSDFNAAVNRVSALRAALG